MFLHGILHRVEGDYDNARAWYADVKDSEVFLRTWKGEEGEARAFIDRVEAFVRENEGDRRVLEKQSLKEIEAVVEFCRKKFGEEEIRDASDAFVRSSETYKKIAEEMITGGKGFRKF